MGGVEGVGPLHIPDGEAGDDLGAAGPRQQRQEGAPVPLGQVAGRWATLPLVGHLYRVEPQCPAVVLHRPEAGTGQQK